VLHVAIRAAQAIRQMVAARTVPTVFRLTGRMGYNPYRKFRAKPADYVLVATAVAVALALVLWGIFG